MRRTNGLCLHRAKISYLEAPPTALFKSEAIVDVVGLIINNKGHSMVLGGGTHAVSSAADEH